jgi:hypothetical protein
MMGLQKWNMKSGMDFPVSWKLQLHCNFIYNLCDGKRTNPTRG